MNSIPKIQTGPQANSKPCMYIYTSVRTNIKLDKWMCRTTKTAQEKYFGHLFRTGGRIMDWLKEAKGRDNRITRDIFLNKDVTMASSPE